MQQSESQEVVYLDNAATTHKPDSVIEAMHDFYAYKYATVHRGLYLHSEQATIHYEEVREQVADFIKAETAQEIVFTRGTTESINCFAASWGAENLTQGDEILVTQAEHHANLVPWQKLAIQTGARLVFIPVDQESYTVNDPEKYLTKRTKLVAVTHHSNVLGAIWDPLVFKKFIKKARDLGAVTLIDGAQCVAHHPVDVIDLGADVFVFSGHKLFGPTGVGVLYVHKRLHDFLQPYHLGGAMVASVDWHKAIYKPFPYLLEAGTPPIAEVIGLGAAMTFMKKQVDFDEIKMIESGLARLLYEGLSSIPTCSLFAHKKHLFDEGHVLSFSLKGIHAHDIAALCAEKNIAVRAGNHCAQPLVVSVLGQISLVRASFAMYSVEHEVHALLEAVYQASKLLS